MIQIFSILFLVFFAPFALVSLSTHSMTLAWVGLVVVFLGVTVTAWSSFSIFVRDLNPKRLDPELTERLLKLWRRSGPEKVSVDFSGYRSTHAEMRVWAHSPRKVSILMSLGFLEQMTDHDLLSAFRRLADSRMHDVAVSNRREALKMLLERFKGNDRAFRYWFLSFWLFPLERLLRISRI